MDSNYFRFFAPQGQQGLALMVQSSSGMVPRLSWCGKITDIDDYLIQRGTRYLFG